MLQVIRAKESALDWKPSLDLVLMGPSLCLIPS